VSSVRGHGLRRGQVRRFLSGGTDSLTIVDSLRGRLRSGGRLLVAFGDGYDEMEYARIAARHWSASS
jgi:asparagine synthetase B (glutamine-hydrolysing)